MKEIAQLLERWQRVTTALRGKKADGQSIVSPTPKRQQSEQATQAPHFIRRSG